MVDHSPDSDLFTSVLDEKDDLVGFQRPWRPNSLVFLCFFAGPFFGGALVGWNFRKLGLPRWMWGCWMTFCAVGLIGFGLTIWNIDLVSDEDDLNLARNLLRALWVITALVFAHFQKHRFLIYSAGDEEPAALWGPGIAAVLLSFFLNRWVVTALALFLDTVLNR